MKILTDLHTHTVACCHAYSTIKENAAAASEKGLEMIALTDHCPAMPDAPQHSVYFGNLTVLPEYICGVKVLKGAELNILSKDGDVDLDEHILKRLDMTIASLHPPTYKNANENDHTEAWLNVMENPYVDILGHTGRNGYSFDIDTVVRVAKEKNVCIEVNRCTILNSKFREECKKIILSCKKHETLVTVSSDSHFYDTIGDFDDAIQLLSECDFPLELIVNRSMETFLKYLGEKKAFLNHKI